MKPQILFFCAVALLLLSGCRPKQQTVAGLPAQVSQVEVTPAAYIPKATAFRMSGDYADHVAVTLNADGGLAYYPAPTDISDNSRPVPIGDGWWLNRQGISAGSVFTKYTFDEYKALKQPPTPAEIKAAIIPGARVTEFRQLPVSINEANALPAPNLLKYLK